MYPNDTASPRLVKLGTRHPRKNMHRTVKALVWDFTYGRCWYCGQHLNPFDDFCVEHVVPLARGGSNHPSNLVPSCNACNWEKGTRLVEEWRLEYVAPWEWGDTPNAFWFEANPEAVANRDWEIRNYDERGGGY